VDHQFHIPSVYNMADDIDRHAEDPGKTAIVWEDAKGRTGEVTYAELKERSDRLAQGFCQMGLTKGSKLFILLPRGAETYVVYLAALKAGCIVMPGSEMLRSGDIAYRVKHAGAQAVIVFDGIWDRVANIREECPSLKHVIVTGEKMPDSLHIDEVAALARNQPLPRTHSDDIAFISYTSGTTGGPKGVIHHHSWAIPHREVAGKQWMGIGDGDRVWATAGPGWAKWVWSPFISTLALGATAFVYAGKFDPEKYLSLMQKYDINVLCCTPTEYRMMAKVDRLDQYDLSSLRQAVSAGEPLNREVIDTFRRYFGVEVRDGYGQTENSLLIGTLAGMAIKPGSMGKPSPGNRVQIIDGEGRPVPPGTVGDIAVHRSAPTLFQGYYRDPERTKQAFRGDWYVTGDQAKEDEDGYFWFEGRADDIILSSGYTIGPFEVEDALVRHPAVRECAVVASPDDVRGSVVKAFVVLKEPEDAGGDMVKMLQDHVKQVTAPYKYPREIEFVPDLPKTASGKIRRVELRALEEERKLRGV